MYSCTRRLKKFITVSVDTEIAKGTAQCAHSSHTLPVVGHTKDV